MPGQPGTATNSNLFSWLFTISVKSSFYKHTIEVCVSFFSTVPQDHGQTYDYLRRKIELLAIPVANQVEMYYCNPSQEKRQLMDTFTHKPEQFKHSDLIAQVENISLLTAAPSTSDTQAESASKSESKN